MLKIFFAVNPMVRDEPQYLKLMDRLMSDEVFIILHPLFDLESEYGKKAVATIGSEYQIEPGKDPIDYILDKDYWLIEKSDVVLYDLDSNPGTHYLGCAILKNKTIIGVSKYLKSVDLPFVRYVKAIIKPSDAFRYLLTFHDDKSF